MGKRTTITRAKAFAKAEHLNTSVREGFSDRIAIIDADGNVVAVNQQMSAWARGPESSGFPFADYSLNYLDLCRRADEAGLSEGFAAFDALKSLLGGSLETFAMEYSFAVANGRHRYLMTASPLTNDFKGAMICHRDITLERRVAEMLRSDGRILSLASVSRSFLPALVRSLAFSVNVDHAFLSEIVASDSARLRTVSHWSRGDFGPSREYLAEGTACGQVLSSGFRSFPWDVQELFPSDEWLSTNGVQSYAGVPVYDSSGGVLGHIAVGDSRRIEADLTFELALRLAAMRAAPELERRRAEEFASLQARLVRSAQDAIVGTDANLHITSWNPGAEQLYGWRATEVIGKTSSEVLQTEFPTGGREETLDQISKSGELRGEYTQRRRDRIRHRDRGHFDGRAGTPREASPAM